MTAKITALEPVFHLDTSGERFHFIVLGIGGTGSDLVAKLCRHLSLHRCADSNILMHDITFCDADVVEEKNLVRQNFFSADLGKNKAEIMALKCATLFDMVVRAVPRYIEDGNALENVFSISPHIPFIIGCVDNNATRRMLHEYLVVSGQRIFYLDAGNEEFAGQVALGYQSGRKTMRLADTFDTLFTESPYRGRFDLPDITYHHPEMLEDDDKFASDLSCAERVVSNPQAMAANNEASAIIFQIICNCIRGKIDYHYVAFDTLTSTRSVKYNTVSALKSYGVRQIDSALAAIDHINNSRSASAAPDLAEVVLDVVTEPEEADLASYNTNDTGPVREVVDAANRVLNALNNAFGSNNGAYQTTEGAVGGSLSVLECAFVDETSVLSQLYPAGSEGNEEPSEPSDDSITSGDLLGVGANDI